MGITGLLPFLEKATTPCSLHEFRGATVVVDAYCWLHKGATGCALQLAQGQETEVYVNYSLKYVKMLQSFDITPILVFDGRNLPAKSLTEIRRREARSNAKKRAAELLRLGKSDEARSHMKQSINVTPEMASAVIKACHQRGVNCIVAPYESDAQLAFFNITGIAEIVITEDSDLVLFGCTKIIYKLDLQGHGYLVEAEKISQVLQLNSDRYTFDKFRHMCILSGCDYVDSLPGIGLKKALKFIRLTEETNPLIFLKNVPRYLNMRHLKITDEYIENFMIAKATFMHQVVFDPFKKKLVHLQDPSDCGTNYDYCKNSGEMYDNQKAYQVALGNLHPTSYKKLDDWCPNNTDTTSIWSNSYKKSVSRKKAQVKNIHGVGDQIKKEEGWEDQIQKEEDETDQDKSEEEKLINKELEFYFSQPIKVDPDDELARARPFVTVDRELLSRIKGDKLEDDEPTSCSEDCDNESCKSSESLDLDTILDRLKKERTHTDATHVVNSRFFSKSVEKKVTEILESTSSETIVTTAASQTQVTNTEETVNMQTSEEETKRKSEENNIQNEYSVDCVEQETGECSTAKRRKVVPRSAKSNQQKISDFFSGFKK